jgi:hypothetical protein
VDRDLLVIWSMGTHHAPNRHDGLGGLVGRGALTAVAALALAGGGAGVAFAGDAPTGDQDASHGSDQGDHCSCGGHDGQDRDGDEGHDGHSDADSRDDDSGSHDADWMSFGSDGDSDDADSGSWTDDGDRGDRGSGPTHRRAPQTRSHAPSTQNIAHGAAQGGAKTVPISSGVVK